ncbi:MAG: amidohydrolase family protein [Candidatus Acidiferrales bacterium]
MAAAVSAAGIAVVLVGYALAGQPKPANSPVEDARVVAAKTAYIDAHVHIDHQDPAGSFRALVRAMDRMNAVKNIVLTEPYGPDDPARWDAEVILPAAKKYPDKLSVLGGGATLNAMILQSAKTGDASPAVRRKFTERAEELLREGAAGFGELSTEHFIQPSSPLKDYESAPADTPLMLLLADIAARHRVPIDLHMEAVPQTMPLPAGLDSPPNPPEIPGNIAGFERLLRHNPHAKIIWVHAGADNTGYRTPDLCRRLLESHPNLYMEIKADPTYPGKNPVLVNGKVQPEWLKLFQDFPDRFIIGSDQHYGPNSQGPLSRAQASVLVLNQLPADLARKIGRENVVRIYGGTQGQSGASGLARETSKP